MKKQSNKRISTILTNLFLALTTITLCSCITKKPDYGLPTKKDMNVEAFQNVELGGNAEVYFLQGNKYQVEIKGREKLLEYVDIKVKNNTLIIHERNHPSQKGIIFFNSSNDGADIIKVYVTCPQLVRVDQGGNTSLTFQDSLQVDKLTLDIRGNSCVKLNKVKVSEMNMDISGNADVNIAKLTAQTTKFNISGNASVNTDFDHSDSVTLTLSDNADITLNGNTRQSIQQRVTGNASVTDNTSRTK